MSSVKQLYNKAWLAGMLLLNSLAGTANTVKVSDAKELQRALNTATPGTVIEMSKGYFTGKFVIPPGISGTAKAMITLKGSAGTILQPPDKNSGYALHLQGNSYWHLYGFSVSDCKKAIVLDSSSHNIIENISIKNTGEEGIHFRTYSCYNNMKGCTITNTGLSNPGIGEACYIGSAVNNWPRYTGNKPDTANYNVIEGNTFGPEVTAEGVDVKEGTTGNIIRNNTFYGKGQKGENSGNSWMEIKGNHTLIENNHGYDALLDGFQVTIKAEGWGAFNIFRNNTCEVNGPGMGIRVQLKNGSANGNIVYSNNTVKNAKEGLTNIPVTETNN